MFVLVLVFLVKRIFDIWAFSQIMEFFTENTQAWAYLRDSTKLSRILIKGQKMKYFNPLYDLCRPSESKDR